MSDSHASTYHEPVMLAETLEYLAVGPGKTILDATLGGGGHSEAIAKAIRPKGTLIAFDRDTDAIRAAGTRLEALRADLSIILLHSDFGNMGAVLEASEVGGSSILDGVLFDLGVSSHQLDSQRGFSFRRDEPLDMRMNTTEGETAREWLAGANEAEISKALWEYGDERWARKIARALVDFQGHGEPIATTGQLASIVERAVPRSAWPRDIHVATRTFQAIRIAVNDELGQLSRGLEAAIQALAPGGRIVALSYHSLEDRIVKQTFAQAAGKAPSASGYSPAAFLTNVNTEAPLLELLTRKPILPTPEEVSRNPRARSAKLRAAMRV